MTQTPIGAREPAQDPATPRPLPAEGCGSKAWWDDQITAAEEKIKRKADGWKQNVNSYLAQPLSIAPAKDTVIVPIDYANVEQKKARLYFRNPEVQLIAAPGHDAQEDAVQAFGVLLNETLGPDGVDAEAMMDEMLTDVLCPAGIGITVLGMEATIDGKKPVITGYQDTPAQGSVLGLQTVKTPITEMAPNIIHQEYFWSRVSPLCALIPARFHGSNFDKAPWLGYKFEMDKALGMRLLGLTEDEATAATDEPDRLNTDEKPQGGRDSDVIYGYCLSYQAALYNPDVKHPEAIYRLILVKGVDRIIKHDQPYQKMAADGRTLLGVRGHFIHIYTPRYVSDSAIPPSDVAMSRHQVDELSKGRSQMIQQRDRAKPMRWININLLDPAQKEKVERGEWMDILLTTVNGNESMGEVATPTYPRENFEFNRIIKADVNETWAFGANQRGNAEETRRTATELSIQQNSSDTRMDKEQHRLAKWYSRGAEKLGGLLQLFEDERDSVMILGDEGEQRLVAWDRNALPLRFVCTAKPDTMVRQDAAGEFKRALDLYQMTAQDPHANRVELLTSLLRKANVDPTKIVIRELPAKAPDKPTVSYAFKGEDLIPTAPQFPIVQQLLTAAGIQIDPANVSLGIQLSQKQMAAGGPVAHDGSVPVAGEAKPDPMHPGAATMVSPLSKHAADRTGKLSGDGMAGAVQ